MGKHQALLRRKGSGGGSGDVASLEWECLAFSAPQPLFLLLHGGFLVGGQCLSRRELLHLFLLQQKPSLSQGMHVKPYNE